MRKRSAEEKQKQLERFLMNVAEAADAALWEYWREKEAEHRRFATETPVRQHSGTPKGGIEAITYINIGYMIRAPTFRRSTQRQEPHPPTTEYRRAAELTQRGDSRLYQRAVFLCGGIR